MADGTVGVARYADEEVILETRNAGEGFLVSSEVHYPGWRAWVDGREIPIYYTNLAFRGVFVPAGNHEVIYRFLPKILFYSGLVSLFTMLAFAAAAAVSWRRSGHIQ